MRGLFICFLHYLLLHKVTEGFIMGELNEEEISEIVIDLSKGSKIDESWLKMMGFGIKSILKSMFGGGSMPVSVRGSRSQIKHFTDTIGKEKKYMEQAMKFGLDNPHTYRSKSQLNKATTNFTRQTGIPWPFK